MQWLDLLSRLVGPIVEAVRAFAGSDWDPDKAEAIAKSLIRRPPRQAIGDDDRARLRDIRDGESE